MDQPFATLTRECYQTRIQRGAKLSALTLGVVGKSGTLHKFGLYVYSPLFEPTPRHYFSPCGRFVVMHHVTELGDERIKQADQFHVYYNGVEVPGHRFTIARHKQKRGHRPIAAIKRTNGLSPDIAAAERANATVCKPQRRRA